MNDFIEDEAALNLNRPSREIDIESKLTVVITTYKQPICLERMILLLRSCPVVAEVRVNWFVEDEEPQTYNEFPATSRKAVIFDKYPDKLSYRFHPRNFKTDAVFSVDVDTFYSCESLAMAYETWALNENAAVGFHGRLMTKDGYAWDHSFSNNFEYNTVFITKGGITHKNMFDEYFKDEYKYLRDAIDEAITAEDMLMSFILDAKNVKTIMACPKIDSICQVKCKQNTINSLNKRTSHKRDDLLKMLYQYFGKHTALTKYRGGAGNIAWQGKEEGVCMSKFVEQQNSPPCEKFCMKNLICPSNVIGI